MLWGLCKKVEIVKVNFFPVLIKQVEWLPMFNHWKNAELPGIKLCKHICYTWLTWSRGQMAKQLQPSQIGKLTNLMVWLIYNWMFYSPISLYITCKFYITLLLFLYHLIYIINIKMCLLHRSVCITVCTAAKVQHSSVCTAAK